MNTENKNRNPSALQRKVPVTSFPTQTAQDKDEKAISLTRLASAIKNQKADSKAGLPWYKYATFGNQVTQKGCLRNDANVLTVTGVECDYDDGQIGFEEAVRRVKKSGIVALLYTTPSHREEKPRWRVMAPLAVPIEGQRLKERRAAFVARLNGLFDGMLDGASFNLSQSFYAGNIKGKPPIKVELVDGTQFIDEAADLDKTALGKQQKRIVSNKTGKARTVSKRDESGSGFAWRFLLDCARKGFSDEQAEEALAQDKGPAGAWYRNAPNMAHQFSRTWENAQKAVKAQLDWLFERLDM